MIRSVTIRKVASGKYFASILVDSTETDFCVTPDGVFLGIQNILERVRRD